VQVKDFFRFYRHRNTQAKQWFESIVVQVLPVWLPNSNTCKFYCCYPYYQIPVLSNAKNAHLL